LRRLLIVLVSAGLTAAPVHDEFRDKVVKFHQAYDAFLRKYVGCPTREKQIMKDQFVAVECDPLKGELDQAAWHKTREAAKELFDLREKE